VDALSAAVSGALDIVAKWIGEKFDGLERVRRLRADRRIVRGDPAQLCPDRSHGAEPARRIRLPQAARGHSTGLDRSTDCR
jgi:hypothetical protein